MARNGPVGVYLSENLVSVVRKTLLVFPIPIPIGPIKRGLILVVYTELDDDVTRIISARSATKREQSLYRAQMESNS
jgi:hypothetical protein